MPKVFLTPGTLSTAKLEIKEYLGVRKKNQENQNTKVHSCFVLSNLKYKPKFI
jgi:hypothetical protein